MPDNLPERAAYTSTATREGEFWFVRCDQHPGIQTKARLLARAREDQRQAIAAHIGVSVKRVDVEVRPVLPESTRKHLARARELRATASWANSAAAAETRAAALSLVEARLSLRDIGTILGVSHQRAHQIIHAHHAATRRT